MANFLRQRTRLHLCLWTGLTGDEGLGWHSPEKDGLSIVIPANVAVMILKAFICWKIKRDTEITEITEIQDVSSRFHQIPLPSRPAALCCLPWPVMQTLLQRPQAHRSGQDTGYHFPTRPACQDDPRPQAIKPTPVPLQMVRNVFR